MNGPVYVDNSPERDDGNNNDNSDSIAYDYNCKQAQNSFSGTNGNNQKCSTSGNCENVENSSIEDLINKVTPTLGTLDLLKEIPAPATTSPKNGVMNAHKYGEFSVSLTKVRSLQASRSSLDGYFIAD